MEIFNQFRTIVGQTFFVQEMFPLKRFHFPTVNGKIQMFSRDHKTCPLKAYFNLPLQRKMPAIFC